MVLRSHEKSPLFTQEPTPFEPMRSLIGCFVFPVELIVEFVAFCHGMCVHS